jgi:hypothetical protein
MALSAPRYAVAAAAVGDLALFAGGLHNGELRFVFFVLFGFDSSV